MAVIIYGLLLIQLIGFGQSSMLADRPSVEVSKDHDYRLTFQFGCLIFKHAPSRQDDYAECLQESNSLRQAVESTCNGTWQNLNEFNETASQNATFFDGSPTLLKFTKDQALTDKPIVGIVLYWIRGTLNVKQNQIKHKQNVDMYKQMADLIAKQEVVPIDVLQYFGITANEDIALKGKACYYNNQTNSLDFRLTEEPTLIQFCRIYAKHYWQLTTDYFSLALVYLGKGWAVLKVSWPVMKDGWDVLEPKLLELLDRYWIVIPVVLAIVMIIVLAIVFRKRGNSYYPQSIKLMNRAKLMPGNELRSKLGHVANSKF